MARFKAAIKGYVDNKIGRALNSGIDAISGIGDLKRLKVTGGTSKDVYPIDLIGNSQYGEFIKFTYGKIKYNKKLSNRKPPKPPTATAVTKSISSESSGAGFFSSIVSNVESFFGGVTAAADAIEAAAASVTNVFSSFDESSTTNLPDASPETIDKEGAIYLYVPAAAMVNSTSTDYESKEASTLKASDLSSVKAFGAALKNQASALGDSMLKTLGGVHGESYLKSEGIANTGKIESFFSGVGLRKWNFSFEFAPRSRSELQAALRICRIFKAQSLPNIIGTGSQQSYPSVWSFEVHNNSLTGSGEVLQLMGSDRCYITNTTLNMAPDSVWSTFENGSPVVFTLTIGMVEDQVMDRSKYEKADYEL